MISGCFREDILRPIVDGRMRNGLYALEYVLSILSWYPERILSTPILPDGAYFSRTWSTGVRDPLETQVLSFNGLSLLDDERSGKICLLEKANSRELDCSK